MSRWFIWHKKKKNIILLLFVSRLRALLHSPFFLCLFVSCFLFTIKQKFYNCKWIRVEFLLLFFVFKRLQSLPFPSCLTTFLLLFSKTLSGFNYSTKRGKDNKTYANGCWFWWDLERCFWGFGMGALVD